MARNRSLEIWHMPKRQNVHQVIGAVKILIDEKFDGRSWTKSRKEKFNTRLGQHGLTNKGQLLAPSGRRTLVALLKYLGFIYIDNNNTPSTIHVTKSGKKLVSEHEDELVIRETLKKVSEKDGQISQSELFKLQMVKLQITNPVINEFCVNVLLFPFRTTLRLLLELGYLTKNEIGYVVFRMKSPDEVFTTIERIRSFRSQDEERRKAEIEEFKKTEVGNITLGQAPTSGYYIALCESTGICERRNHKRELFIPDKKVNEAKKIVSKFEDVDPFDFDDNLSLWIDYFGNDDRLLPPTLVSISVNYATKAYLRVLNTDGEQIRDGVISKNSPVVRMPLFLDREYKFEFYDFSTAKKVLQKEFCVGQEHLEFEIGDAIINRENLSLDSIKEKIFDLTSGNEFDEDYQNHLNLIQKFRDNFNFSEKQLRGGRLEFLIYKFFEALKGKGKIDDVIWNGSVDEKGIAYPAPGGPSGNPDLLVYLDNYLLVVEVTTIRSKSSQWSNEAASVHDHIHRVYEEKGDQYEIVGLFCAPVIADRVESVLTQNESQDRPICKTVRLEGLVKIFSRSKNEITNLF